MLFSYKITNTQKCTNEKNFIFGHIAVAGSNDFHSIIKKEKHSVLRNRNIVFKSVNFKIIFKS